MSLSSFLTNAPMTYTPATSQISTSLPDWYQSYANNILTGAANWAAQGYQTYGGPRVAALTPDQQASYGTVAGAQGMGSGAAQQGANLVNGVMGQPNASAAADPYLRGAAAPLSSQMGQFWNPFLNNVVANNNTITNRQFTEQALPALQDVFTRSGQVYGGSGQGVMAERMARDLNLNQLMSNAGTLSGGFNTALGGAEAQAGLLGNLGSTAGGLANASQNTGIGAGYALGNLGNMGQNAALTQAEIQNRMGQQQQAQTQQNYNTAYQDFQNQVNYPLMAAQGMGNALSGIRVPTGTTSYQYAPYGMGLSPVQNALSGYGTMMSMFGPGGSYPTPHRRGGRVTLHLPRKDWERQQRRGHG